MRLERASFLLLIYFPSYKAINVADTDTFYTTQLFAFVLLLLLMWQRGRLVMEVLATVAAEYTDLVAALGLRFDLLHWVHQPFVVIIDIIRRALAPHLQFLLLRWERVQGGLVLRDRLLIELNHTCDVFADGIGQDELRTETMDLVEFTSEPGELSHDLNKATASLSMLKIDPVFFLQFLLKLGI